VRGREEFETMLARMEEVAAVSGKPEVLVEVNLVGERRMAALNRDYRGRRGASEILTFVYGEEGATGAEKEPAGEIYLCWKRIAGSATRLGVSPEAYLLRLLAHGLCHIRGLSHDTGPKAERMEDEERKILEGILLRNELDILIPRWS
jgi:probable rRNA maturation factor